MNIMIAGEYMLMKQRESVLLICLDYAKFMWMVVFKLTLFFFQLEQMDLEVKEQPGKDRQKYQTRVRSYKTELSKLQTDVVSFNLASFLTYLLSHYAHPCVIWHIVYDMLVHPFHAFKIITYM